MTVHQPGSSIQEHVPADRGAPFDRNWLGPVNLKPRVYRSQIEKDVWYSCVVENEYRLPPLKPEDVVIDIGAHIGGFSYQAHMQGSRQVYAFEVDPWHIEGAQGNLAGLDGVNLFHFGIVRSDREHGGTVKYSNHWSLFTQTNTESQAYDVPALSLDEILNDFETVRFLKIDVEGSEWPILYTCTQLAKIQEIAGEYHTTVGWTDDTLPPKSPQALLAFLRTHGFKTAEFVEGGGPDIGLFYCRR